MTLAVEYLSTETNRKALLKIVLMSSVDYLVTYFPISGCLYAKKFPDKARAVVNRDLNL